MELNAGDIWYVKKNDGYPFCLVFPWDCEPNRNVIEMNDVLIVLSKEFISKYAYASYVYALTKFGHGWIYVGFFERGIEKL